MNVELETRYFEWLYNRVVLTDYPTPSQKYYRLFKLLHTEQFIWTIIGDDNRAAFGQELRKVFLAEYDIKNPGRSFLSDQCSVLEMLIAFADLAEFETDKSAHLWFWIFLENLEMSEWNDTSGFLDEEYHTRINQFIFRKYARNGNGGLFPLRRPKEDQRNVEIWYQFCAYVIERGEI